MTKEEFNAWLEEHYTELLKVAKNRIGQDAEDALQSALARITENLHKFDPAKGKLWTWCVNSLRSSTDDARVSRDRRGRLQKHYGRDQKILRAAAVPHGWKRPAPRAE